MKYLASLLAVLLLVTPALAVEEICGDGLDNDSSGGDLPCPSPDADHDGYTTDGTGLGYDCDDSSMFLPAMPWTRDGCTGLQAKKCNTATGAYGSCTTPTEGSTNYYIDATSGNDANPCSFASPCLTFLKFSQYISASPPGGYIDLAAGRTVWVFNGTLDETYTDGSTVRPSIYTRRSGSSGNPIRIWAPLSSNAPSVTVNPAACDGTPQCPAVSLITNSYVDIRGLNITGGFHDGTVDIEGAGISSDGDNHTIVANHVYDNEGPNSSNPCGISLADSPTNMIVTHNRVHDNYDRTAGTNQNEKQICAYTGTGNDISYNVVYNTAGITDANNAAGCIWWKHGQATATNTITHNRLWNCKEVAIGSMNDGTRINHNLVLDSDFGVWLFWDWAGSYYVRDSIVEYNTFKNTLAFRVDPEIVAGSPESHIFRYNIYVDDASGYGNESSVITVHPYGTNANFTTWHTGGFYTINSNCYYNTGVALEFGLYESGEASGAAYSFTNWKGTAGYDTASFNENPTLDSYHRATSTNCRNWGWLQTSGGGGGGANASCLINHERY